MYVCMYVVCMYVCLMDGQWLKDGWVMYVCMYVCMYEHDDAADDDVGDSISQYQLNDVNVNRSITIGLSLSPMILSVAVCIGVHQVFVFFSWCSSRIQSYKSCMGQS